MERKQFTFYVSFFQAVQLISRPTERCRVYEAICRYGLFGEEPDREQLGAAADMAWQLIQPVLDAGRRKAAGGTKSTKSSKSDREDSGKIAVRCGQDSRNEGEKEVEKEVEVEIEKEIEIEDNRPVPGGWEVLQAYRDKVNPQPSPRCTEELERFVGQVGPEVCLRAIDEAVDEGKAGWAYIRGILRAKAQQGVRSLADWDALEVRRTAQRAAHPTGGRHQVGCVPGQINRGPDRQAVEDMERMRRAMERMREEEHLGRANEIAPDGAVK